MSICAHVHTVWDELIFRQKFWHLGMGTITENAYEIHHPTHIYHFTYFEEHVCQINCATVAWWTIPSSIASCYMYTYSGFKLSKVHVWYGHFLEEIVPYSL